MAASGNGIQAKTIREGRQNIRIPVPSMLAGVRQTSAQNKMTCIGSDWS
jgi:hypothetical protein